MTKRGRKRHATTPREPSGRVNRQSDREREAETIRIALEARQRVHGAFLSEARYPEAGYAVGRLYVALRLSKQHLDAAHRYEALHHAHARAILARPLTSAADMERQPGHAADNSADPDYIAACAAVERAYAKAHATLRRAGRLVPIAMEHWVIDDREVWRLILPLQLGLAALAKLWRIPGDDTGNHTRATPKIPHP